MNRGHVLQSPLVQQMVAGNPNWWNINNMRPPSQQNSPFLPPLPPYLLSQYTSQPPPPPPPPPPSSSSSSSSLPFSSSWHDSNNNQEQLPESWSQLLLGGLVSEEDKSCMSEIDHHHHQQAKKLENWEEQLLSQQPPNGPSMEIKLEDSPNSSYLSAGGGHGNNVWTQMIPNSSPKSCVTSLSTSMLDFSSKKADGKHPPPDHSSECNSSTGGALKKARVQPPPTQSTIKVRKEKLGDRITALHQIVSPFGKTDTASVLLEAIGYIRFLQSQIEALSLPYLGNTGPGNMRQQQHPVQGERNCLFPEDPGQVSHEEPKKDLRSRGLCLVPISCTMQVGSDNGADYWAPAIGGGFQ